MFDSYLIKSSNFSDISTSNFIVANVFDNLNCSILVFIESPTLPGILSFLLMILSTSPYLLMRRDAVYFPTPGTPVILSDLSPKRAK